MNLKQVGIFLVFVVLSTLILSFLVPASQKVERSVQIQAPAAVVYQHIAELETFNTWSVWAQNDSSIKNTITGEDGTVGASVKWAGNPAISGEGAITIKKLEAPKEIEQEFNFIAPRSMKAHSNFVLKEEGGITTVTWTFTVPTSRPWNIFNLFQSMDKDMGNDFEQSLNNLKQKIEKKAGITSNLYEVSQVNFPGITVQLVREEISNTERNTFMTTYFDHLKEDLRKTGDSATSFYGLIYKKDVAGGKTEIGAAVGISPDKQPSADALIKTISIPASKAIAVEYTGDPANMQAAYLALEKYVREQSLEKKEPVIEEYITAYQQDDRKTWRTRLIFLVD